LISHMRSLTESAADRHLKAAGLAFRRHSFA
jgi:hypothetical protein